VGIEGLQEKAGMAKEKLDGHHRTRSEGSGKKPKNWWQTKRRQHVV